MQNLKDILGMLGALVLGLALVFGLSYFVYQSTSFFKPKYVELDNQVFKESQQYNDGMIRDLENMKMEFISGNQERRDAIRAVVIHRFSVYPQDKMTPDLRNFYNSLLSGKQ